MDAWPKKNPVGGKPRTIGQLRSFLERMNKNRPSKVAPRTQSHYQKLSARVWHLFCSEDFDNVRPNFLVRYGISQEWSRKTYSVFYNAAFRIISLELLDTLNTHGLGDETKVEDLSEELQKRAEFLWFLSLNPPPVYSSRAKDEGLQGKGGKQSKKYSIQGLDELWPVEFLGRCSSKYRVLAAIQFLSSSRPADFAKKHDGRPSGVVLRKYDGDTLEITTWPCKFDGALKGQRTKTVRYFDCSKNDSIIYDIIKVIDVALFKGENEDAVQPVEVTLELPSTLEAYRESLKRVGHKMSKNRKNKLTSYSLRHWLPEQIRRNAAKSEGSGGVAGGGEGRPKARGVSPELRRLIAFLLGHQATRTQRYYGLVKTSGGGAVQIGKIETQGGGDPRDNAVSPNPPFDIDAGEGLENFEEPPEELDLEEEQSNEDDNGGDEKREDNGPTPIM